MDSVLTQGFMGISSHPMNSSQNFLGLLGLCEVGNHPDPEVRLALLGRMLAAIRFRDDTIFFHSRRVTIIAEVDPGEGGVRPRGYYSGPIADTVGPDEECWTVAVRPDDPDRLLVGCGPVGVYGSSDAGIYWNRLGDKSPMPELTDIASGKFFQVSRLMRFAFDPSAPDLVFGACETNGLVVSRDGGDSWRNISEGLVELSRRNEALQHLAHFATTVLPGTVPVLRWFAAERGWAGPLHG